MLSTSPRNARHRSACVARARRRACALLLLVLFGSAEGAAAQRQTQGIATSSSILQQATEALQRQQYQTAMDGFEAALNGGDASEKQAAQQGEERAAIALALQERNAGHGEAALETLEHARDVLPQSVPLLTDLGIQAESLHRFSEAAGALAAALALKPDDLTALYALAHVELDKGQFPSAEKHLQAYLQQRPNDATAHYGLGHLYQMQQRTDEAAVAFRRSIELKPVQTESYYQLGQMALDAHRDPEAAAEFEKTLGRMPTHGGALTGMGILAFRAKNFAQAQDYLRRAVGASPDYQPAHYYLGLTEARLGDKTAGEQELKIATDLAAKQQGKGQPVQ